MGWISTEVAWPLAGIKVLTWWPNWGGIFSVLHVEPHDAGVSWVSGSNARHGRKVMRPTHWQFLPEPPPEKS